MKHLKLFENYEVDEVENMTTNEKHATNLTNQICRHFIPIDKIRHKEMIYDIIEEYFKKHELG